MNRLAVGAGLAVLLTAAAGLALSIAIASALYAFNWYSFYDTRRHEAETRAEEIADDLALLAEATAGASDPNEALRAAGREEVRVLVADQDQVGPALQV